MHEALKTMPSANVQIGLDCRLPNEEISQTVLEKTFANCDNKIGQMSIGYHNRFNVERP